MRFFIKIVLLYPLLSLVIIIIIIHQRPTWPHAPLLAGLEMILAENDLWEILGVPCMCACEVPNKSLEHVGRQSHDTWIEMVGYEGPSHAF